MCILIEHDKGTRFIARYGQHQVIIGQANGDDPEDSMSPGRLFLATLGACAGLYAAAKLVLTFPEPIADKYRGAVLRAADQCYVKQSIINGMDISVSLSDSQESAAQEHYEEIEEAGRPQSSQAETDE